MGWYDGMDEEFARRLRAFIEASGGRIGVGSGYRSIEHQTELWNKAVIDYGEEEARNWVAPPGHSNHNHGVAADLSYLTEDATAWAHENAPRFGLNFPMSWEDWHIEPIGVRDGTYTSTVKVDGDFKPGSPDAYTTVPPGEPDPSDAQQRFDLGYQLAALNSIMMRPQHNLLAGFGGTVNEALQEEPA